MKYIVLGALIVFAASYIVVYTRRREINFEGEVVDKDIHESVVQNSPNSGGILMGRSGVTHTYLIKVKTDSGKQINYQVTEGKYEIIKIGDRVSKPKGTTDVNVMSSNQNSQTSSNPLPPQTFV